MDGMDGMHSNLEKIFAVFKKSVFFVAVKDYKESDPFVALLQL